MWTTLYMLRDDLIDIFFLIERLVSHFKEFTLHQIVFVGLFCAFNVYTSFLKFVHQKCIKYSNISCTVARFLQGLH